MYRAVNPLHKHGEVIPPGSITRLEWVNEAGVQALIQVGAVTPDCRVLSELPGWKARARLLFELRIETVHQFFLASETDIAAHLKVSVSLVQRWKTYLLEEAPPLTGS